MLRQTDRSSYLSKEQAHIPQEGILLHLNSLKTEARRRFQKQGLIRGRIRDSWPWPGSSCWSWRWAITSKEWQTVLDCSSLWTLELTFQIKSNHFMLEYLSLQRPRSHGYLWRMCSQPGFQRVSRHLPCSPCPPLWAMVVATSSYGVYKKIKQATVTLSPLSNVVIGLCRTYSLRKERTGLK